MFLCSGFSSKKKQIHHGAGWPALHSGAGSPWRQWDSICALLPVFHQHKGLLYAMVHATTSHRCCNPCRDEAATYWHVSRSINRTGWSPSWWPFPKDITFILRATYGGEGLCCCICAVQVGLTLALLPPKPRPYPDTEANSRQSWK